MLPQNFLHLFTTTQTMTQTLIKILTSINTLFPHIEASKNQNTYLMTSRPNERHEQVSFVMRWFDIPENKISTHACKRNSFEIKSYGSSVKVFFIFLYFFPLLFFHKFTTSSLISSCVEDKKITTAW